jgi:SAM-dependent methyltransferase
MQNQKPPQTGYVIDQELLEEMARLRLQGTLLTEATGGAMVGVRDPQAINDVLDLACGPGEWAIRVARESPRASVVGIDKSRRMIEYACVQAQAACLQATFRVMDITEPLAFPDASFDLLHIRLIAGFMQRGQWPALLADCFRLARPGGQIVITEQEMMLSNDPTLQRFMRWWSVAFARAGLSFVDEEDAGHLGVTLYLKPLLSAAGFHPLQQIAHVIDLSTGEPLHEGVLQDLYAAQSLGAPFLLNYQIATQQELDQMQHQLACLVKKPDFLAHWHLVTVSAVKSKTT